MIVMNAGRMEQFGTPAEVYARPATTFVASFIGSPPMNLLAGRAEGASFRVGSLVLALAQPAPNAAELTLGVRPEHLVLQASQAGQATPGGVPGWQARIELIEMLGAERLVYCRLVDGRVDGPGAEPPGAARRAVTAAPSSTLVTVRVDAQQPLPEAGAGVTLLPGAGQLHWFDSATGQRL
jgi:sn-glycerol 3-phosphate transport system ATP-binding protein